MYILPFWKYKEEWMLPFLPEILLQVLQEIGFRLKDKG
jgi:hypothetical protein